jgi:hypothetical protein
VKIHTSDLRDAHADAVVDDVILLSRWAARLPSLDDAHVVIGLCRRFGALPCVDSGAHEHRLAPTDISHAA